MFDVIAVGSATIDAFVHTEFNETLRDAKKRKVMAYPVGSKILINDLQFTVGGGGTNTAVAFARLGCKTSYLGKIGSKASSSRVIDLLKKEKIDGSLVSTKSDGRTGYSIILDCIGHDRTILAYKGSNNDFGYDEIKTSKLKTKWFYFASMVGKSFKTLEKLAVFAEKKNIKIAFNPSCYLTQKGPKFLKKILSRTEVLILNKEEGEDLVGKGSIAQVTKKLHTLGPRIVAVTDGKKLTVVSDGDVMLSAMPRGVPVVEATGAGDAFASSLVAGLVKGKNLPLAFQMGMQNSESVILHHGAKELLMNKKQMDAIIKKKPFTIKQI